jgi:hypothetical protein
MLSHSGPLGLAHRLLNIKLLLLSCVSTKDSELMQLKTVQEGHTCLRMPTFGHLTVYCSPRVTLVHLAANTIPSGLCVTGQQVPQLLIRLGDCLVVSLLGLMEQISTLRAVTSISIDVKTVSQDSEASWRFFNASDRFTTALAKTRHFLGSPFCSMIQRTATMCARYSILFPREKIGTLMWDALGSLTFNT